MGRDMKRGKPGNRLADLRLPASTRVTRTSLAGQAADALRKLILRNVLAPGAVVTEREVAEKLGISRTPAREAVRVLIKEGLIDVSETGRLSIADPDIETVVNLVRVLGALEGLAAELTASLASDAALVEIAGYHRAMQDLIDDESDFRYFDSNIAFHRAIVAASGNPQLSQTHKQVDDQLYQMRYRSSRDRSRRAVATREHDAIVKALLTRDGPAARRAMARHLSTTIVNLRALDDGNTGVPDRAAGRSS